MIRLAATSLAIPGRLAPCDLMAEAGTMVGVVGPNGAGKTSLLRALAGIEGAGEVRIDDVPLAGLPPRRRAGLLGYLSASRDGVWDITARDHVMLGLADAADPAAADDALVRVDALALASRPLSRLSTGERARVMLARALVARPTLLLLDEPIANLDPRWQLRLLAELRAEAGRGTTILLAIHDLALARRLCDRILIVDDGRVIADGPSAAALDEGRLASIFGVRMRGDGWELI